jgi:hypothetical protein
VVGCIIAHCCLVFDKGEVRVVVVGCIIDHCCLVFDKGEVRVVVVGCKYNQPQQHEPLLCQTPNNNGR